LYCSYDLGVSPVPLHSGHISGDSSAFISYPHLHLQIANSPISYANLNIRYFLIY